MLTETADVLLPVWDQVKLMLIENGIIVNAAACLTAGGSSA